VARPYGSLRVFDNPVLESLTHVHPAVPLAMWGPVVTWLLWRSVAVHHLGVVAILGVGIPGLLAWSLAEYLLHRHLFHIPPTSPRRERLQFMIHGLHHADPEDPTRLVLPPVPTCIGAVVFYSAFRLALGPTLVDPFFAFFAVGYLCYDYIHLASHRCHPRNRLGRLLKANHMSHHYVDADAHWGVSSPLWDWVFGTARERPAGPGR
jgi:sterol desaturase/sphingolipid hydroxylase (fatty acid hydroxylase superfamily)